MDVYSVGEKHSFLVRAQLPAYIKNVFKMKEQRMADTLPIDVEFSQLFIDNFHTT